MEDMWRPRILDLIGLSWNDLAFSKYLLENPSKCKLIQVDEFSTIGCSPEELQQEGWVSAKTSADAILGIVECIYSVTEDIQTAKYVSEHWDKFFNKKNLVTKRKSFEKFFSQIPNCDALRTLSILKACSKDCVNIAAHHLDEKFSSLSSLKHPSKHQIVIKTASFVKERLRVIHSVESTSKLFNLDWQLIVDFEWKNGVAGKFPGYFLKNKGK